MIEVNLYFRFALSGSGILYATRGGWGEEQVLVFFFCFIEAAYMRHWFSCIPQTVS